VPDYANDLVKVVAIFGVIHCVPAHNVFCYSAVAHVLTLSVNLTLRPKSGFKNKYLGLGSGFKMRPFYNSVWVCRPGSTSGDWKDKSSTHQSNNRLKSFCEASYAILGQMFLLLVRGYQWRFC